MDARIFDLRCLGISTYLEEIEAVGAVETGHSTHHLPHCNLRFAIVQQRCPSVRPLSRVFSALGTLEPEPTGGPHPKKHSDLFLRQEDLVPGKGFGMEVLSLLVVLRLCAELHGCLREVTFQRD